MDEYVIACNCWLDRVSSFSKEEMKNLFPWLKCNSQLLEEEIEFWIRNKMIFNKNGLFIPKHSMNKPFLIFLDIDGVLNHRKGNDAICEECLNNLAEIVEATNGIIILISSWKSGWNKDNKEMQDDDANYLDERLKEKGLHIYDKSSRNGMTRLFEIIDWVMKFNTNRFLILDDDYGHYKDICEIEKHLILTDYYDGGLNKTLTKQAILLSKNLS